MRRPPTSGRCAPHAARPDRSYRQRKLKNPLLRIGLFRSLFTLLEISRCRRESTGSWRNCARTCWWCLRTGWSIPRWCGWTWRPAAGFRRCWSGMPPLPPRAMPGPGVAKPPTPWSLGYPGLGAALLRAFAPPARTADPVGPAAFLLAVGQRRPGACRHGPSATLGGRRRQGGRRRRPGRGGPAGSPFAVRCRRVAFSRHGPALMGQHGGPPPAGTCRAGLARRKLKLVCALPQWGEHLQLPWPEHMAKIQSLFEILQASQCEVSLSLHPKASREAYETLAAQYGLQVAQHSLSTILPEADIFVASWSSTLRWSAMLGIASVNLDWAGQNYALFSALPSLRLSHAPSDLPPMLAKLVIRSTRAPPWVPSCSRNPWCTGKSTDKPGNGFSHYFQI
jgi:hypothetical protein